MNIKAQPNHRQYLQALKRMTPEERLNQAFALSEYTKQLLRDGLRQRYPDLSEVQLHEKFLERLARCYNQNY